MNSNWCYVENNTLFIQLKGNATTGYLWNCVFDDSILSCERDEYVVDKANDGMVGVGGTSYYEFKAKKDGKVILTFNYKRNFEDSPIEIKTLEVKVKNGEITINE